MSSKTSGHILVVDDQDNWRKALTCLLGDAGHTVKTAACFEDALDEISHDTFDIVVLDVRLVDADVFNVQGIELLRLLKTQKTVPGMIILTGHPESIRPQVLEEIGDALVLKVPPGSKFDRKGFKDKILKLLGN
jgi:CheY-like chemotaxis protein